MRIAFLTDEYVLEGSPDGGLANYLWKMCWLLRDHGHEPVVFLKGTRDRTSVLDGVPVVERRSTRESAWWRRGWSGRWRRVVPLLLDARRLAAAVAAEQAQRPFDVIQIPNYGALGRFLAGRAPVPVVMRMSSYQPLWRTAAGMERTLHEHVWDWLEIGDLVRADAVFAPSDLVASTVSRLHGLDVRVIRTPCAMPPMAEDPSLHEERLSGQPYVLFVGSMSRLKGVDLLAAALPAIFARSPRVHAVLVGGDNRLPGGKRSSEVLRAAAGSQAARLHLLGVLPRARLTPIIRHASVVVIPSRVDNYPNTCLEAQALGRIVVGTRLSSLDEMIEDGVTGFLADPESPAALAAAVTRALSLGDADRARVETSAYALAAVRDVKAAVDEHLALYAATIRSFAGRRATPGPRLTDGGARGSSSLAVTLTGGGSWVVG